MLKVQKILMRLTFLLKLFRLKLEINIKNLTILQTNISNELEKETKLLYLSRYYNYRDIIKKYSIVLF